MSRGWNLFPSHLQMSLVPAQHPNGLGILWWDLGAWGLLVHLKFQRIFRKTLSLGLHGESWGGDVISTPAPCSNHPWFYNIQHHSWAVTQSLPWWSILNSPSNSVLGFGLALGLLMSG